MGMSSWIMDLEEEFEDKVVDIIKESEDISEAYARAIELNKHLVNWSDDEIEEAVSEIWNEYWSKISMSAVLGVRFIPILVAYRWWI